jgi:hypothetical protein
MPSASDATHDACLAPVVSNEVLPASRGAA